MGVKIATAFGAIRFIKNYKETNLSKGSCFVKYSLMYNID